MIGQLQVLLRVKRLKEEQALRALQVKRGQAEEGRRARDAALADVRASAASLPAREDAIYDDILGHVVDLDTLDATRGRVVALEKAHGLLVDSCERAEHVLHRLDGEVAAATTTWQGRLRVRDKYALLTDEKRAEIAAEQVLQEEGEVEELFARRRAGPGEETP